MSQLRYDVSDDFLKGSVTDAFGTVVLDLETAYDNDGSQMFLYRSDDDRFAFGVSYDPATGERSLACERSEARLRRELKAAVMRTTRHAPANSIYLSPRLCDAGYFQLEPAGSTAHYAVKEIGETICCAEVTTVDDCDSPSGKSYVCTYFFPGDGEGSWPCSQLGPDWRAADPDAALRDFVDEVRPERQKGAMIFFAEISGDTFSRIVDGEGETRDKTLAEVDSLFPPEGEMRRLSREHERKKRAEASQAQPFASKRPLGRAVRRICGGVGDRIARKGGR